MDPSVKQNNMQAFIPVHDAATMKICDKKTIAEEPISSVDLMERAARKLYNKLISVTDEPAVLHFVCGPGNNGGDGLCMARYALQDGRKVKISLCVLDKYRSQENTLQADILSVFASKYLQIISKPEELKIAENEIVIDGIFGTGLQSAVQGDFAKIIENINANAGNIISIDTPSGLFDEAPQGDAVRVKANYTLAIQTPKLSFFYPENKIDFCVVNAGIKVEEIATDHVYLSPEEPHKARILSQLPVKNKFGNKGTFGHTMLVGGNSGMHGAIALAAEACIATGAGLTTVFAPAASKLYLGNIPKAMHIAKPFNEESMEELSLEKYSVLAIGPGLGNTEKTTLFLRNILQKWDKPALLDADALNIIAANEHLWQWVKPGSIITPHPGEFARLFGKTENGKTRLELAKKRAAEKGIYILLKDTYSAFITPLGKVYFNGSGGSWLAQGGTGDRLTGMIAGLWARTGDAEMAGLQGMYRAGMSYEL